MVPPTRVTDPAALGSSNLARALLDKRPLPGEYFFLGCQREDLRGLKDMRTDDRPERRHGRRYPIQLPLALTPRAFRAERGGIGWTHDLSEQGACVELAERLQSPMPFLLCVQTDSGVIDVEASMAWCCQSPQSEGGILHGVIFTRSDPDLQRDLQGLFLSKGLIRPTKVRLPFEVTVTCHGQERTGMPLRGRTRDISRGGLLIRLGQVVPPGTALELTLHTPAWPVTVGARVVWVAPPEGRTPGGPIRHGMRFTSLGWTAALALARFLLERP
jgi:hypothetical protein